MVEQQFTHARITRDAVVTGISALPQSKDCPFSRDERFEVRAEVPLDQQDHRMAVASFAGESVDIRYRIRSGLAQSRVDGFYPNDSHQDVEMETTLLPNGNVQVLTFLSLGRTESRDAIFEALQELAPKKTARVANMVLLPKDARLPEPQMIRMNGVRYAFDALPPVVVEQMLTTGNSARDLIARHAERVPETPSIPSRGFAVSDITLPVVSHHVACDSEVFDATGKPIDGVAHGNSLHFFPGRAEPGDWRQLELWNTNGHDVHLGDAYMRVWYYRACAREPKE